MNFSQKNINKEALSTDIRELTNTRLREETMNKNASQDEDKSNVVNSTSNSPEMNLKKQDLQDLLAELYGEDSVEESSVGNLVMYLNVYSFLNFFFIVIFMLCCNWWLKSDIVNTEMKRLN